MRLTVSKCLALCLIVLALPGCAWWEAENYRGALSYHSFDGISGYGEVQLDRNSFLVTYHLYSASGADTVRKKLPAYLLYRCSDLAINNGYDYFVTVNEYEAEAWLFNRYTATKTVTIKLFRDKMPSGRWGIHNTNELRRILIKEHPEFTQDAVPEHIQNRLARPFRFSGYTQKDDDYGGYSEVQLDDSLYRVIYEGSAAPPLVFYRAAELTLEKSYDYFELVSESGEHDRPINVPISRSHSRGGLTENRANYGGGIVFDSFAKNKSRYASFNVSIVIKMHKGPKPEYNYAAYDAREILENLGPLISPPGN